MDGIMRYMATVFSPDWWMVLLHGLFAIAFGVLAWLLPGISIAALVILFGAYAFVDDILGICTAFAGRKEHEDR